MPTVPLESPAMLFDAQNAIGMKCVKGERKADIVRDILAALGRLGIDIVDVAI